MDLDISQERNCNARLKRGKSGFEMEALQVSSSEGLQIWGRYLREAIAPPFGLTFSQAIWNAGFVVQDPEIFLLVTLAKEDMSKDLDTSITLYPTGNSPGRAKTEPSKNQKTDSFSVITRRSGIGSIFW